MTFLTQKWVLLNGIILASFFAQITSSTVDSTLSGVRAAQSLTDRGIWIVLLIIVISLCGWFLRNASKEVEHARKIAGDREDKFMQKEERFIQVVSSFERTVSEIQRDNIKIIERNSIMLEQIREAINRKD